MFFLPTKLDIITTRFTDVGFLTMSLGVPQIDTEFGFCHWMSGRCLRKSLKVSIPLSIIKQNGEQLLSTSKAATVGLQEVMLALFLQKLI